LRVVLDANVLVSAVWSKGVCAEVLARVLAQHRLIAAEATIDETRKALREKFGFPDALVALSTEFIERQAQFVRPKRVSTDACRDPKDLYVLGLAVAARAHCIVTGDPDLLVLGSYRDIPIVKPREFLALSISRREEE